MLVGLSEKDAHHANIVAPLHMQARLLSNNIINSSRHAQQINPENVHVGLKFLGH